MKHSKLILAVIPVLFTTLFLAAFASAKAAAPSGEGEINGDAVFIMQPEQRETFQEEKGEVREEQVPVPEEKREKEGLELNEKTWYKKYWWRWICPGVIVFIGAGFGIYYLVNRLKNRK